MATPFVEETAEKEETVIAYNEEDDEHDSKERVLQKYFLQEWELIKSLIDDIVTNQHVSDLHSVHKIRSIMDKYQEQGQLIEPYLDSMVSPLMFTIRIKTIKLGLGSDEVMEMLKPICIIIYSLITVCGYKAVMKFFPHHVSDLELAVSLLEKCHNTESATSLREESTGEMEAKCVLLLWLSILVLVPFDISSVDTSIAHNDDLGESELSPLVLKMVGFCKDYLSNAGSMRSIAGLLLSKLLTRPDMPKAFTRFIHWTHDVLSFSKDDVMKHFQLLGVVEALAAIFKAGGRKLLYDIVPTMWNDISSLSKSGTAARSPLLRKCLVKLTQRIGLICLPHRSPSWHYVSKIHSLGENVSDAAARKLENQDFDTVASDGYSECFQDEDMDVPEIIEEIIEMLLAGLRDTDTVVRWSAAKGIGRITFRLTSALSEEVLSSVLELFSPGEGDGSWHGGCLALAELARRGLLLPNSLPKVVLVVVKALHYDVRRGPHSVGSHIRDAAAYVCWAFGRTYYHADMRNVLDQLAPHLLKVACYDREVNCRRASAAAFQENVGRQGNYPHGIDIVNTADYFSLSSRVNSYLHIAVSIAQYEGYLQSFAEELLFSKIRHWDKSLRELAAEALSALVKYDPEYFSEFVLEKLIPCTLSPDLCTRHGATLAAAELVLALHHCNFTLSSDKQKRIANMVPAIEKARLYRGKGGEIMRLAVSRFIECVALSNVLLPDKTHKSLFDTLNENLRHPNSQIQDAAVKALKHFMIAYLVGVDYGGVSDIALKYSEMLGDPNVAVRRGSALALGALPYHFLANRWRDVIIKLSRACLIEDNPEDRDAEARVNAVKGVISVCETLTLSRDHPETLGQVDEMSLYMLIKDEVMTSLLRALDDYSVDNRGDVGSWVREAAMNGLERCSIILCSKSRSSAVGSISGSRSDVSENSQSELFYDVNLATSVIGGISKQAVEKLDKLREAAALVLQRILYNEQTFVPFIPHREKLEEIVPNSKDLNWGVPTISFPRFVKLLWLSCYSRYVLSGLVISIGGLQDSLRKSSTSALMEYLEDSESEDQEERRSKERVLSADLLWVLENYRKCDRVITPTLKTIEILFSKKILLDMEVHASTFLHGLLDSLTIELKGLKDFSKLYAGIAILGYIASSSEPISIRAFSHLLTLLGHRYPKIRKASAEQVYLVLLQNVDLLPVEKMEKAFEVILETCWEGDIEEAKQQKSQLFGMAGLEVGSLKSSNELSKSKSIGETKKVTEDENATYSSLVESSGF